MKILYVANIHNHFKTFHKPYIEMLKSMGCEVHVAANGEDLIEEADVQHYIDIQRTPFSLNNIKAYMQLKRIIEREKFDIVHAHTPMGGILGRFASSKERKKGMRVIYTSHGFHFCKGGPLKNWILYYPIEKFMARYTDIIITINKEDTKLAKRLKIKQQYCIPGIGIDLDRFKSTSNKNDKTKKRLEIGVDSDEFLLLSIGDLSVRKNHQIVIKALSHLNDLKIKYVICGVGEELHHLENLAKQLGVSDKVKFLGFRRDIHALLVASDAFVFPSLWEGLGMAGIEAMASGVPVIASNRHGIKDYAMANQTALLCNPNHEGEFVQAIRKIAGNNELSNHLTSNAYSVIQKFRLSESEKAMRHIYGKVMAIDHK